VGHPGPWHGCHPSLLSVFIYLLMPVIKTCQRARGFARRTRSWSREGGLGYDMRQTGKRLPVGRPTILVRWGGVASCFAQVGFRILAPGRCAGAPGAFRFGFVSGTRGASIHLHCCYCHPPALVLLPSMIHTTLIVIRYRRRKQKEKRCAARTARGCNRRPAARAWAHRNSR
jgi:hypothetical protein